MQTKLHESMTLEPEQHCQTPLEKLVRGSFNGQRHLFYHPNRFLTSFSPCEQQCLPEGVAAPLWVIWFGSFTSVGHRYGRYRGILHVLLNKAKRSTFMVLGIPYLAFGRCPCTSMFYDTISHVG